MLSGRDCEGIRSTHSIDCETGFRQDKSGSKLARALLLGISDAHCRERSETTRVALRSRKVPTARNSRSSGTWEQVGAPTGVTIQPNGAACQSYAVFNRTTALVNWIRGYVPDAAWFPSLNTLLL